MITTERFLYIKKCVKPLCFLPNVAVKPLALARGFTATIILLKAI